MKTVGIIGGLGPETTAKFYLEIISLCYEKQKNARPPLLMWSVPLPYDIEKELITKGAGEEKYLPYLIDVSKKLESGGADFLVMPCNTMHIFIEEIRKSVAIPVLSIVDETARFLKQKGVKEIGMLATMATVKHKLYQQVLEEHGIQSIFLDDALQDHIGEIINNLVLNRMTESEKEELFNMFVTLSNCGRRTILLACTDLQLAVKDMKGVDIYDTMKILAEATANEILG